MKVLLVCTFICIKHGAYQIDKPNDIFADRWYEQYLLEFSGVMFSVVL